MVAPKVVPRDKSANWFSRARSSLFPHPMDTPVRGTRDPIVSGGGPVADVGVHCVDTLRFILQDEVSRVSAREIPGNAGEVEAGASMVLEFSRGTLATVAVSFLAEYRTPLELVGKLACCGLTMH